MRYKKVKKLNLIPENLRYDLIKDQLIKSSIFIIILAFLLIIFDYSLLAFKNKQLEDILKKHTVYKNNLEREIASLDKYEKNYKNLKNELQNLLKEKNKLFRFYTINYSPLISTIFYLTTKPSDIYFKNISYSKNTITLEGYANKTNSFYKYYKSLETNKYLNKLEFYFIKRDENNNLYTFKITMKVKEIDEIN
ncbi:conserved hypothetical protein [Deferribacter desulfuricans SSM1]|uniref:Type IV pilus assembly protein PilN n=1 Tax=Deferribacter desulfuricans (strain DSM 14783 / JCM 11476 / NBRC 101012 / SSM1) TaxID=639282 RepID=D3PDP7_DEFDS|nr:PilN domain-containing protein [Deferribacter desulfuricans]BAI80720.1 conserved hypothetical protein [Deferribacter desulfuricans SSM1]